MKLAFLFSLSVLVVGGFCGPVAQAQWSERWLKDEAYWGDGKAEFNLYEAKEVRYGQARPSEVIHIFVREPFSNRELVKAEPSSAAGSYPVLKLNQILHVPTGIYVYQQMHSAFWRVDSGALIKATLTSNDSCGNTYKEFRARAGLGGFFRPGWDYEWHTYWEGMSAGRETVAAPKGAIFYDELPMRVRTIDFQAGARGEFQVPIASSVIRSKKDEVSFALATFSWAIEGEKIQVRVISFAGTDQFELAANFPYRLERWQKADGSVYALQRSLKIDYWNFNKLGDQERALALP